MADNVVPFPNKKEETGDGILYANSTTNTITTKPSSSATNIPIERVNKLILILRKLNCGRNK